MTRKLLASAAFLAALTASAAAGDLKSGPQPGTKLPGPFSPLNVNGEDAGQKRCLVCKNGSNPVVMIFARTPECPATAKLIKAVDAATGANASKEMGSFVVFLSDDEKLEAKLKDMVSKENVKNTVVSIDTPTGPSKYNVAQDADLTVVFYNKSKIVSNHAFKKGELKEGDVDALLKDVSKILE